MTKRNIKNSKLTVMWPIYLVVATVLALLVVVNWDIFQKEQHLANGKVVRLTLAPIDPRSLMQGDYMVLNYAIAADISKLMQSNNKAGFIKVSLDNNQVASLVAVDDKPASNTSIDNNELIKIQYRLRNNRIKFASNAFFFEEGQAERFEWAKYGEFRVNEQGELLLEALLDRDFNKL